jgi:GTP-binding protein
VDGSSADPVRDMCAINNELKLFSYDLAMKPQIVIINKIDLPDVARKQDQLLNEVMVLLGITVNHSA